jgi:chromosome condensin MukBEF complex kleisin-like MukF subunit
MATKQIIAIETIPAEDVVEPALSRMNLNDVDAAICRCDLLLREVSGTIKELLENGVQSIPSDKLKQLRQINARKSKLIVRRLTLLCQSTDTKVKELVHQLLAINPGAS